MIPRYLIENTKKATRHRGEGGSALARGPTIPTMSGEEFSPAQLRQFRRLLLAWFDEHARDLPWRRSGDPYAIWVSEIMLQQTRVNAVLEHYALFMRQFPTIQALAEAEEPEVLAIWSGLGYYRRARMLHKAAQFVMKELAGIMPKTALGLRTLPGIGEYTSAAIASIAFGEAAAVVDGNVERVVTRLARLESASNRQASVLRRAIRQTADQLLDQARPGDFNQAMMELGATICLPRNPLCLQCPVQTLCRTRGEHTTAPRKEMSSRPVSYAFVRKGDRKDELEILLEQRPHEASLMAGMWELPEVEGFDPKSERLLLNVRHSITTTNYYVTVLHFLPEEEHLLPERATRKWVRTQDLTGLPLTGLARKVLKRLRVLPGYASTSAQFGAKNTNILPLL
jgi:A/G-specific adenine glycosylase